MIDTPGHADFTFEVTRSLRILDGAVCIVDGVAGVEAQTEKVWHQATAYHIPRLIFVNKLDRDGASFHKSVKDIASRLHTWPVLCQIPWWSKDKLAGIGDVINLHGLSWPEGSDGRSLEYHSLDSLRRKSPKFASELISARKAMIEILTEHDESLIAEFIEADSDVRAISAESIQRSLRTILVNGTQKITPVFAGASFRNIGVQPLLDSVNDYLPSPRETTDPRVSFDGATDSLRSLLQRGSPDAQNSTRSRQPLNKLSACALAFKVVNDSRRGVLVYVRVYSGSLARNNLLYNTNLSVIERAPRLFRMYASEAVEISSIDQGQIGVISGLNHARTGDTLIVWTGANVKTPPPKPFNRLQLQPIAVPPPLFFASVEPSSLAEEKGMEDGLALLLREDPSLSVSHDAESGQTHLAGMGELHLEIARDRLLEDFKVKASMGKIEISFREAISEEAGPVLKTFDREIVGKHSIASCSATVAPLESISLPHDDDQTQVSQLAESNYLVLRSAALKEHDSPQRRDKTPIHPGMSAQSIRTSLRAGTAAALSRGPSQRLPLHSTVVTIDFDPASHLTPTSTVGAVAASARLAVSSALDNSATNFPTVLMEPVMNVTIAVNETTLGAVVHDISSARGGSVVSLDVDQEDSESGSEESPQDNLSAHEQTERLTPEQLHRVYAPPDLYGRGGDARNSDPSADQRRQVKARVPLKEMVGYLKHLRGLTGGRGTFIMSFDRFERVTGQRARRVLAEMRGE